MYNFQDSAPGRNPGDNEHWLEGVPGERIRIRVSGSETANAYGVIEAVAAPGSAAPLHFHREDETFVILEGTMSYHVGDRFVEASVGATVFVPAGVLHCWRNRSAAPVRTLAIFAPGGVEELFRQIGGKSPDEIAVLASRYGSFVAGPPTI